jgi:hypothetical protein
MGRRMRSMAVVEFSLKELLGAMSAEDGFM